MYGIHNYVIDPERMLCGGYNRGVNNPCRGDSGGPYFFEGEDGYKLQGIVNFGMGCARRGYPIVYARVPKFVDWIRENGENLTAVRA